MTETQTAPLALMTLSSEYPTHLRATGIRESTLEGNDGVFYAMTDPTVEPNWMAGYAVIVLSEDDPRHAGMWPSRAFPGHYGWNVPQEYLTPVDVPEGSENGSEAPLVTSTELADALVAANAALADVKAERDRLSLRVAEQRREFEAWKARATEIAHQYADDNSLCEEFDRCMEEIGLEGRTREYRVTVSVSVEARNEDDAWEQFVENYATDGCYAEIERED